MGKRLVIKTVLICFGIFLILNSIVIAYVFKQYPLDLETHVSVMVATVDIAEGTVIGEIHLKAKEIQQSALDTSLATDLGQVIGKKAMVKIPRNDYVRTNALVTKNDWFKDDERILILPMNIEERLANLIQKGAYVDIRLKKETSDIVETILYKVKVEDVLDETGASLNSKSGMNSRTTYMELILDKAERQKIYSAKMAGKLIYELYCDETQKPAN
ncbi:MAG: SAF domain-containing protein [Ruminiclostridium sp.]